MRNVVSNEWVEVVDGVATLGITEAARLQLGEVVFVELPEVGRRVSIGDPIAVLESSKAAVDINTPVAGTVVAVNITLRTHPSVVNTSPEKDGWLCKIR